MISFFFLGLPVDPAGSAGYDPILSTNQAGQKHGSYKGYRRDNRFITVIWAKS
jgi:hypothetical protein